MAGHLISEYLSLNTKFEIVRVARDRSSNKTNYVLDATDFFAIENMISEVKPNYVINAVGILNTDAENNPDKAVLINSFLPHFLAKICTKFQSKLIHISTDCVFNGKKGSYLESDFKDGIGFYAQSKALGEVCYNNHTTIRTSIIGPDIKSAGIGLLNWVLSQKNTINGYSEAFWGGVTTLELAKFIEFFIENKSTGITLLHLTNNLKISKLDLIKIINDIFKLKLDIKSISDYKVDKSLISSKNLIDYKVPSYEEMTEEMYNWIILNKDLYPHYNLS